MAAPADRARHWGWRGCGCRYICRFVLERAQPWRGGENVTYVLLMLGVSLLARGVPTRRALRLELSQVMRADA